MELIKSLKSLLNKKYTEDKPLITFMTNYVTALDLVDCCVYAGGSPVLTDDIVESHNIIPHAGVNAVMLNFGTITREYLDIMVNIGRSANKFNVPVMLDPAAISASPFRSEAIKRVLDEVQISILKGNLGEIKTILGYEAKAKGIDSFEDESDGEEYCVKLSKDRNMIVAMTGKEDIITDGKTLVKIKNGTPRLQRVVGTGSSTGALITTFSGHTDDYLLSTILGILVMGISGEIAEKRLKPDDGNRTFKLYLHDALSNITPEQLEKYAQVTLKEL
ncbi:hydroxyethylthiazole kinase [Clostridium algidicarnis]|uniref:hydroxyethylthiazole kinase n=1 Tax=Clostridium algidicarnis TaxID=37659 RepID=UPI001C0C3999|nr:hydroxyethylthiazole kinase [Clostridium algidicarnis]MBU3228021.1 hydroxyethylthiazole kinase [Clostridium algidicarnis]MBU3251808.1 hydroxyethylthiazole kinase [Clostridium algidicarnis]